MLLPPSNFKCWLRYKISMLPSGCFSTTAAPALSLGALSHHLLLLLASSHTLTISAASSQQSRHQNPAATLNRSFPPSMCLSAHTPHMSQQESVQGNPMVFHRADQSTVVVSSAFHDPSQNYRQGLAEKITPLQNKTTVNLFQSASLLFHQISHHGKLLCA